MDMKIGPVFGVISMCFSVFFKLNVQNGENFWGCKNLKYYFWIVSYS